MTASGTGVATLIPSAKATTNTTDHKRTARFIELPSLDLVRFSLFTVLFGASAFSPPFQASLRQLQGIVQEVCCNSAIETGTHKLDPIVTVDGDQSRSLKYSIGFALGVPIGSCNYC